MLLLWPDASNFPLLDKRHFDIDIIVLSLSRSTQGLLFGSFSAIQGLHRCP